MQVAVGRRTLSAEARSHPSRQIFLTQRLLPTLYVCDCAARPEAGVACTQMTSVCVLKARQPPEGARARIVYREPGAKPRTSPVVAKIHSSSQLLRSYHGALRTQSAQVGGDRSSPQLSVMSSLNPVEQKSRECSLPGTVHSCPDIRLLIC